MQHLDVLVFVIIYYEHNDRENLTVLSRKLPYLAHVFELHFLNSKCRLQNDRVYSNNNIIFIGKC